MVRLRQDGLWRPARDIPFIVLSAALVLSLIRSVDQPSVDVGIAGTSVSLVPADLALAALAAVALHRLLGSWSLPRPARAVTYSALAFSVWLLISSASNGFDATVGAAKLLEYGLLGLGIVPVVRRRGQLWLLVGLLVLLVAAAAVYGALQFLGVPPLGGRAGQRQPSW